MNSEIGNKLQKEKKEKVNVPMHNRQTYIRRR
jgi:hypothetical protein